MKIVLYGVETNNKGAELMLYAILQEIERKYPKAEVFISPKSVRQGLDYVKTPLNLKFWPFSNFVKKTHLLRVFQRLHLPLTWLEDTYAVKADYFFDASGFCFSDQCNLWGRTPEWWEKLLKRQFLNGTKIVFLPQAFGPFELEQTQKAISILSKYSSIIIPREEISYKYLENSGLVDQSKIKMYPDFTSLVEGVFPKSYEKLRNGICIIPNKKMIDKGKVSYNCYIDFLTAIIAEGQKSGHPVYLLNHEGVADEELAYRCKESIGNEIMVVTGLNALEVKGLIASAYIVVTSRFHGLASALNSCVPALATSWSHKYEELFRDYGITDGILPLDNLNKTLEKINFIIDNNNNIQIRTDLKKKNLMIVGKTAEMWNMIWRIE